MVLVDAYSYNHSRYQKQFIVTRLKLVKAFQTAVQQIHALCVVFAAFLE